MILTLRLIPSLAELFSRVTKLTRGLFRIFLEIFGRPVRFPSGLARVWIFTPGPLIA